MINETRLSNSDMNTTCLTLAKYADRSKDGAQEIRLLWTHALLADYENEDGSQSELVVKILSARIHSYRTTRHHLQRTFSIRPI